MKDTDNLERIQRRATKMIPELNCESRLLECGLTTLETMRLRGDQIEVFKIVNGYEDMICFSNSKKAVEPEDTKQH